LQTPNPSFKGSSNGSLSGAGRRYALHFRSQGPAGCRRRPLDSNVDRTHCALDTCSQVDTHVRMYTVFQTEEFVAWLDDLKDKRAQLRVAA